MSGTVTSTEQAGSGNLRMKVLKGSMLLSVGQAVSQGCAFIRNIILANLLTKEDFGLASTFAITIQLFELVNRLGMSTLMVQSKEGEKPEFEATVHTFQLLAGLVSSLLLFASARWVSNFFNSPEALWAFQLLAVIPLMQAIGHLDISRFVRSMRYGPSVLVDTVPQVLITVAAYPLAIWMKDYRVILWVMIIRWILNAAGTHVYAQWKFRFAFKKEYLRAILDFSWPLLINGMLMFGVLQGDRFLVGHFFTKADLAAYSIAAQLTLVPGMMIVSVVSSIMMPILSAAQSDPIEFRRKYRTIMQILSVFSGLYAIVLIVAGEKLVTLMFGAKYAGTGVILGWLVSANAFRIIRAAPAVASSAKADTKNHMISNIFRFSGLGLGLIAIFLGQNLATLAACGLAGEALASLISTTRLSFKNKLPIWDSFTPMGLVLLFVAASGALALLGIPYKGWPLVILITLALLAGFIAVTMICLPQFTQQFLSLSRTLLKKLGRGSEAKAGR